VNTKDLIIDRAYFFHRSGTVERLYFMRKVHHRKLYCFKPRFGFKKRILNPLDIEFSLYANYVEAAKAALTALEGIKDAFERDIRRIERVGITLGGDQQIYHFLQGLKII
jgi:hypothetical protein